MTAEQAIKQEILSNLISSLKEDNLPEDQETINLSLAAKDILESYEKAIKLRRNYGDLREEQNEFRYSARKQETGLECEHSRHYDSKAVAKQLSDNRWVGFVYWYGGGKHGDPDSIDFTTDSYFLDVVEEQVVTTVRTFSKKVTA